MYDNDLVPLSHLSVTDGVVGVHVSLLLQNMEPLLHSVFVLNQRALVLLQGILISFIL